MGTLSLFLEMENPMLYIVTPQKTVKTLQNLAKKRHQNTGEKHIDYNTPRKLDQKIVANKIE